MTDLRTFRLRGERMLKRWGKEMQDGEGRPNILALVDHIPEETGERPLPRGGGMFSPEAERADRLLKDIRQLDRGVTEYLVAFALGLSVSDMHRSLDVSSRSKAAIELEAALSAWAMAVYFRSKTYHPEHEQKAG